MIMLRIGDSQQYKNLGVVKLVRITNVATTEIFGNIRYNCPVCVLLMCELCVDKVAEMPDKGGEHKGGLLRNIYDKCVEMY